MKFWFILFTCFFVFNFNSQLSAQTAKVDSVLLLLQKMPNDSNRVNSYNYVANHYLSSDVKKADEYLQKSIELAKKFIISVVKELPFTVWGLLHGDKIATKLQTVCIK